MVDPEPGAEDVLLRLRPALVLRWFQFAAIALSSLILLKATAFLIVEPGVHSRTRTDEEAFLRGPTGTDIMPLVVMHVLPEVFPENFQLGGPAAGDWVR